MADSKSTKKGRYKFKSLQAYASTESLFGTRKFRKVFIDSEIDYLRAEIALYNILFDEEDWKAKGEYKCYKVGGKDRVEQFKVEFDIEASKDTNIIKYSKGWGNADRTFWKPGEYIWECYIDGELAGSTVFYVEKEGLVTAESNPYFAIESIKMFEGGDVTPKIGDRTYYTQFKTGESRYVQVEVSLNNKLDYEWHCELEFYYYNANNQQKAYFTEHKKFTGNTLIISTGWGNMAKTGWADGIYTCEVLFMGRLVAVVPFGMGNSFEEGIPQILTGALTPIVKEAEIQEEKLEELILDLNKLTGLESIKKQVTEYIQYLRFEEIRKQKGLSHNKNINLHTVFTGNPGTGKTTVAKKMGKIFKAMGLLTGGHVHEVDRSDLVGEFIGQTAPKVKEAIKKARGGVLFIDEAYSLSREGESSKDYGKEVIEILLKEMSDGDGNIAIFVAGYPREMDILVKSNPGLKSRFGNYYNFPDYLPEDLMTIAKLNLGDRKLFIDDDALEYFKKKVIRAYRDRDDSFGNARYVLSLVDGAKMNMALRLVKKQDPSTLNDKELSTINIEDVQGVFASTQARKLNLAINEERLRDAMDELETLIGMENIKQEIRDMIKLVRYYNEIGKDVLNKFVMHTVFKGNPGTGKTTVARIFAKIFYALGILEKGHLVECDRASLIGEYSGQTAPKTLAKIEEAIGGVLFIDEAYSLVDGGGSLGKEAISTILKQMEDRNTEFILIAAGYPKNMDAFLLSNPGLKSRFDQSLTFEDYQVEELSQIADLMFNNEELSLADDAKVILDKHLSDMYQHRDEFFGNAREVRKLVQQISQFHHLRLADMESSQRTVKMITTVTVEDLTNLKPFEGSGRIKIGF